MKKVLAAVGITATLVLANAAGAHASTAHVRGSTAGQHPQFAALAQGNLTASAVLKSTVGAGYFATPGTPNVSSASAQFTVPNVSCYSTHGLEAFYPGIWIYDSSGTLTQQVDMNFICNGGALAVYDIICIAGSSTGCIENLTAAVPGDRMVATFSESAWHTQGQLKNLTTGTVEAIYDGTPAPTTDYTVFVGDAGPDAFGATHIPTFATVPFSKVTVDGYYMSEYSNNYPTALKSASAVQIKTSPLRGDGDAFSTSWLHF